VRRSFCDLGQTVAEGLGLPRLPRGESFWDRLAP
jgi:phosphopentomutase